MEDARALLADLVAIDSVNPRLVPGGAGEAEVARFVGGLDSVERLAHGPFPDGVDVDLEPLRIEPGDVTAEAAGLDHAQAAVPVGGRRRDRDTARGPPPVPFSRTPSCMILTLVGAVAGRRGPRAALDEFVDLLRPTVSFPPQRADDPRGQLAAFGQRRVGDLASSGSTMASCQWVMPSAWSSAWA